MKQLDNDETETSFVIKVRGSTMARIVPKDDAQAVHSMLVEALAEAPEVKDEDPAQEQAQSEPSSENFDGEMGVEEAVSTVLQTAETLLKSPEAQKVKSFFA